jgi:hypothetical protein
VDEVDVEVDVDVDVVQDVVDVEAAVVVGGGSVVVLVTAAVVTSVVVTATEVIAAPSALSSEQAPSTSRAAVMTTRVRTTLRTSAILASDPEQRSASVASLRKGAPTMASRSRRLRSQPARSQARRRGQPPKTIHTSGRIRSNQTARIATTASSSDAI